MNLRLINNYFRFFINFFNRKKLKNKNFSLIASNCNGMFILKDLNIPYRSPFVNLWLYPKDFIKFLKHMDYYCHCELNFIKEKNIDYPVGVLDDIVIYFQHYTSETEAYEKWNKRIKTKVHLSFTRNILYVLIRAKKYGVLYFIWFDCNCVYV